MLFANVQYLLSYELDWALEEQECHNSAILRMMASLKERYNYLLENKVEKWR